MSSIRTDLSVVELNKHIRDARKKSRRADMKTCSTKILRISFYASTGAGSYNTMQYNSFDRSTDSANLTSANRKYQ